MRVNSGNNGMYANFWNTGNTNQKSNTKSKLQLNGKISVSGKNHVSVKLSNTASSVDNAQKGFSLRRMLSGQENNKQNQWGSNSIINSSLSYSESIRAAGKKAKDAALQVKKLQYSFKSISSKLIRCKTSSGAKQVVSQAKREIMRLKSQKQDGKYDKEELEAAITHAQAMERVAKKKARHLEEEEMAKAAGGACAGNLEEVEQKENEKENSDDLALQEEMETLQENQEQSDYEEMEQVLSDELPEIMDDMTEEMMAEMMAEMTEEMSELMKDMGLEDMLEEMSVPLEKDVDPADLKLMKIKHRNREMKDIAKADGEYLKAMFEKFEREKATAGVSIGQSGGSNFSTVGGGVASPVIPIADAPSQAPTISIDISI